MSSLQHDTSQVGIYPCDVMLPGQDNKPRHIFQRPTVSLPTGLNAHLSNGTLTHDSLASTSSTIIDGGTGLAYNELSPTYGMISQKLSVPHVASYPLYPHFMLYSRADPIIYLQPQPSAAAGKSPATEQTQNTDKLSKLTQTLRRPRSRERCTQETQSRAGYFAPQSIAFWPNKLAIKRLEVSADSINPVTSTNLYADIYSNSGFDILGILAQAISRPNPKINVGPVDLSCALVVCDILRDDNPIVYVSEGFERLTGYSNEEVVGQNCRFLQGHDNKIKGGAKRRFVDGQTVFQMRSSIAERCEIQTSIINYRKDGEPFINLITMIPIKWESGEYRFYLGFLVDLNKSGATTRNMDRVHSANNQRDQCPQYVVSTSDVSHVKQDLDTHFTHDEVTAILKTAGAPGSETPRHYLEQILVDNTDDVIYVLSFSGEFLFLSPSCTRILEYDPMELIGRSLSAICHPGDTGSVIRDLRARTTTNPIGVIFRIRQKFSGYMWFESRGAWHIEPGQGRAYMVMTGRPRPVYALDQIARLGLCATLNENDIWAKVSVSGVILFVSSQVKFVTGHSPTDLVGKGLQELMEPETGSETIVHALEAAARAHGGPQCNLNNGNSELPAFIHQMRHKKGHMLQAHTILYPGDGSRRAKPSFLVAQIRLARPSQCPAIAPKGSLSLLQGSDKAATLRAEEHFPTIRYGMQIGQLPIQPAKSGINRELQTGNQIVSSPHEHEPATLALKTTHTSNWQVELRELKKRNRVLSGELQRLLIRKERKRNHASVSII